MSHRRPPKKFHPEPFAYHQEIELRIDSLSNLGKGVGRIDNWVVFVPFCLPGERVRARVYRNDKRHSEADLVEVLEASPDRVTPRCPLFGVCGGCQYQHLAYPAQLAWKQRQVAELLRHMTRCRVEVAPVIAAPPEYGYRSKITPHFQKPKNGRVGPIGFLEVGRRSEIVDVSACPIAMPAINARLQDLRREVHENAGFYRKGATLLLRASESEPPVLTDPSATCYQRVNGLHFAFPAGEFFQNNPFILEAFTEYVKNEASGGGASYLVDVYCGSGLFCLTAASAFTEALGIEISEASVCWGRRNAEANGVTNARFIVGMAEALFPDCAFPGSETAVIVDPPRKGCDRRFLEQLFAFAPQRVVYVSCNPATQMRDLEAFAEAGYRLEKMQPFDLFPQTRHLECVATLSRA